MQNKAVGELLRRYCYTAHGIECVGNGVYGQSLVDKRLHELFGARGRAREGEHTVAAFHPVARIRQKVGK